MLCKQFYSNELIGERSISLSIEKDLLPRDKGYIGVDTALAMPLNLLEAPEVAATNRIYLQIKHEPLTEDRQGNILTYARHLITIPIAIRIHLPGNKRLQARFDAPAMINGDSDRYI